MGGHGVVPDFSANAELLLTEKNNMTEKRTKSEGRKGKIDLGARPEMSYWV